MVWFKIEKGLRHHAYLTSMQSTSCRMLGWMNHRLASRLVGCMRQVLGPGALGRPRGIGWRGRWEWGLGWGIHVTPWLIHVSVWQNSLQYCKVISLQLIKINEKKEVFLLKKKDCWEKYQQLQKCRWYHSNGKKWRGTKNPLYEDERGEWKSFLKTQLSKELRSWHPVPLLHGK